MGANRVIDRCGSTNDLARALGEGGAPHGAWISARIQEQGRGRLGRQWQSAEGNLFLSMIARIEDKSRWTWVPLAAAVAAARFARARFPGLRIAIKWPNDLWVDGAKLGGILCEAVGNRDGSFIVIGLGLNCAYAPEGLDQATASLSQALATEIRADDVRAGVIESLRAALGELEREGTAGLALDYERFAALAPGQEIEWSQPASAGNGPAEASRGRVRGLGPSGELLVEREGTELRLYAEDVRVRKAAINSSR